MFISCNDVQSFSLEQLIFNLFNCVCVFATIVVGFTSLISNFSVYGGIYLDWDEIMLRSVDKLRKFNYTQVC